MIPKFRAWDKHSQKMFTNSELVIWNGNVYANDSKKLTCENLKGWSIDDEYLMQSTGLFDKNGVEIFDGDIVKLQYTIASDFEFFRVTRFRGGAWRIDNRRRGSELWLRNEDCEVCGNVYQNPELLERLEG